MTKTKSILLTIIGTMITAFGIGVFLTPNKIVGGGVSGLSTILYHAFSVPPGVSFFVINFIFLAIGFKVLGKEFTLKTMLGASLISLFVQIFSYIPYYTENTMLATVFGGTLYGLGIGLGFVAGASTGGTDILGRLIQCKFSTVPIGKLLLVVDGIIIFVSLVIFKNIELTLFGVIALFISSFAVDFVIGRFNISRIAFIITEKGDEISQYLVSTSPRGVTIIDVIGAYTNDAKKMLFCALKEGESDVFQRKILEIDSTAFIVFSESQRIKGNGFYLYK
ncbi:MAG: YitT family protein [Ruminococcaceae bacterium]|nr:YitT family protein [Oscillospiraceae bacterium]